MHFKYLELIGFKSFAEKTKLAFEPGVTTIVGPNGCGKCLSGESEVTLADGAQVQIRELVESAFDLPGKTEKLEDGYAVYPDSLDTFVLSLNPETFRIEPKPVYAFIKRTAPEYLLKITTKTGRRVVTTHYHPFFSIKDSQMITLNADQLNVGTKISSPRVLNTQPASRRLDLLKIFMRFKESDSVYIAHSEKLSGLIHSLREGYKSFFEMGTSANIKHLAIRLALDGQAMSVPNFTAILKANGLTEIPEFVDTIKSKGTGSFILPREITPQIARFLGYIISEGRLNKSDQVWFVNEDDEVIKDYAACADSAFGVKAKTFSYKKGTKDVLIFSHALCQFLEKAFDIKIGGGSRDKKVPPQIFSSDQEIMTSFLSALFEGDGYISAERNGRSFNYFEYTSASRALAEGVAGLLLRLGVISLLREKHKAATNTPHRIKRPYYSVYVYGTDNVKRLACLLQFAGKKREKLEKARGIECKTNPNLDLIPEVNRLFKELVRLSRINVKKIKTISPKLVSYYEDRCLPSRNGLREALSIVAEHGEISGFARSIYDYLTRLAGSDIYWDEITKIEKVYSEKWVYDLSVSGHHNFIAQDIIVHNSNIADAIRWVLGEQSAKSLRASKMEDIIFNGTDTKEPINLAEVSLTFSNEKRVLPIDYDEVTITRRGFRSGESEYLLNKTPVRLKDIAELLMGTGIGTESYSIIEQGRMDLILSSKPEDRRYVFEEASGITKYKSKKKEALRKLEQTEQNILRINDIIQEVKRQIGSIERQAKKAEKYKIEFDKLKDLEIRLSFFEYKGLNIQEKTYAVESHDLKEREKELEAEAKAVASKIALFRQSLDGINQKISDLKNSFTEMNSTLAMNNQKISTNAERIEESRVSQEGLNSEIASINAKLSSAKELVEKLRDDLARASEELSAKKKNVEVKEASLTGLVKEIEELDTRIKTSKTQTVDYLARETKIKNELIKLGADIQNRRARQRRLSLEKETVLKDVGAASEKLEVILGEFNAVEARITSVRSQLESKKKLEEGLSSELKGIEARIIEEENKKAAAKSKIEFLEDLVKRHEGFQQGVKSLLVKVESQDRSFGGILGVLADIIKVERGYEEAVSTFLNSHAQILVAEKDSDIRNAVEYLKSNRLGKASFVSLETLKRINSYNGTASIPSGFIPLKNFIKADSKCQAVVEYFFSNVYFTESAENLPSAADHLSFVTRNGFLYDRGKVSAGSSSESEESLLIGRKGRLDGLKSELKQLGESAACLSAERAKKNAAAESLKAEIRALEEAVHAEDISFANAKAKKESEEAAVKKLKEELAVVELELEESNEAVNELTLRGEELNKELNHIESEKASLELLINELQNTLGANRQEKETLALQVTALKTEMLSFDKEEAAIKENLGTEEAYLAELNESLASKKSLLAEHTAKAISLEEEIASLKLQNEEVSIELRRLGEESGKADKEKSDLIDKLSIDELQLKDREESAETLRNQARDLDVKLTELNFKKSALKERVNQSYKANLETLHIEIDEGADWDAIKTQVAELKEKLDGMGPVNLVAIDEHKELEERYAFLTHQHEDLLNAKDSLLKAIQKINKTTKDLFIDTFQKIQVEFKNFFRMLFGGGQAELVLIDEQDILESGIEIIVRPPGKKLQNLMLMSGGEKALTATALLFAIFKVKPSPFCVLDEIDAPLDESNIGRFANVLKEFLKMSQFIIITHNKRTIELADVMYGITMQERGISKIVSVKFSDGREERVKGASEEKKEDREGVLV